MKNIWKIDLDHSELRFEIAYLMISKVAGYIGRFEASFETDENGFKQMTDIRLSAELDSLNTNSTLRDDMLKSEQYFNAANYSHISFTGAKFEQGAAELPLTILSSARKDFRITGSLTIKGIAKPILLEGLYGGSVTDTEGRKRVGFAVKAKINRSDFEVGPNPLTVGSEILLGEEVFITASCQFVQHNDAEFKGSDIPETKNFN